MAAEEALSVAAYPGQEGKPTAQSKLQVPDTYLYCVKWLLLHVCPENLLQTSLLANPNLESYREVNLEMYFQLSYFVTA